MMRSGSPLGVVDQRRETSTCVGRDSAKQSQVITCSPVTMIFGWISNTMRSSVSTPTTAPARISHAPGSLRTMSRSVFPSARSTPRSRPVTRSSDRTVDSYSLSVWRCRGGSNRVGIGVDPRLEFLGQRHDEVSFGFVTVPPDTTAVDSTVGTLALSPFLTELNHRISTRLDRDRQIGHAFLLSDDVPVDSAEQLSAAFYHDIVP